MMCIGEPPVVKSRILDIGSGDGRIVIGIQKFVLRNPKLPSLICNFINSCS